MSVLVLVLVLVSVSASVSASVPVLLSVSVLLRVSLRVIILTMSGNTNEEVIKLLPALKEELKEAADGGKSYISYMLCILYGSSNFLRQ